MKASLRLIVGTLIMAAAVRQWRRKTGVKLPKVYGGGTRDVVEEASWESFPASDPPAY